MHASDTKPGSGSSVDPVQSAAAAVQSAHFLDKPFDQCKVLIVKLSAFGDVLQTFAVVSDLLRAGFRHIDWAVDERFAAVARLDLRVNKVIAVPLKRWQRQGVLKPATVRELLQWRCDLREVDYDVVLDVQGLIKSAVVGRLARAHWRLGYARPVCGEPAASRFYDLTADLSDVSVDGAARLRTLASKLLGYPISEAPSYGVSERMSGDAPASSARAAQDAPAGADVYLVPGASKAEKLWDELSWTALAQHLIQRGHRLAFIWGADDEHELAQRVIAGLPSALQSSARIQSRLPLAEYPTVLRSAQAVIGVDTGMMHLASLLGLPSVVIFTSTLAATLVPEAGAPALPVGDAGRAPTVEHVITAFERVLERAIAQRECGSGYHRAIDASDDHDESVAPGSAPISSVLGSDRYAESRRNDSAQTQRLPDYA